LSIYCQSCPNEVENLKTFREGVEEDEGEEEKRIGDAEKKMNQTMIQIYTEGTFASILFFFTLWHLLKGLPII